MAVELDLYVGLLLPIEHEGHRPAVPRRPRISTEAITRRDVRARRREIERQLDRIDQERRRTVVEPPPDHGAVAARKHRRTRAVLVRTATSLRAIRRRRSASHWAGSRRPRRARHTPSSPE